MPNTSLRRRLTITLLLSAVSLAFAWNLANLLSGWYFHQRMERLSTRAEVSMRAVNLQIDQTLSALQVLEGGQQACDAQLYLNIANLVAANRFIYEAAVQLESGKACSSYGREANHIPTNQSSVFFPGARLDYWFFADREKSQDEGFIVVSQGASYVWLNKGIVLSELKLGEGVGFNLVDTRTRGEVFSSGLHPIDHRPLPAPGTLSIGQQTLDYVQPNQWHGLVSLLTLSRHEYQKVWWGIFALALAVSLIVPVGLLQLLRWGRRRYFSITSKLRKALNRNDLSVNYQPIVNISTGDWVGIESLLRWNPDGQPLSPAVFIPAAEQAGMISEVTRWVVRRVCEDYSQYLWACNGLYITVNLSAQDIEDPTFPDYVRNLLDHYEIPAHLITFEVTESALLDREKAAEQLKRLGDQGHRIAVDDFGTGYSSLSYLSELPIDILKIDRSFLSLEKIQADDALWRHVVSIARSLNLTLVAEGIEHAEQATELNKAGVDFAQGWLYAKDLPPSVLAKQFFRVSAQGKLAPWLFC